MLKHNPPIQTFRDREAARRRSMAGYQRKLSNKEVTHGVNAKTS